MRIYGGRHLILTAAGTLAVFIIAGLLLGFVTLPIPGKPSPQNSAYADNIDASGGFFQEVGAPVNLDNVSRDERENIEIYRQLNEGVVNITSVTYGYNWFLEPVPEQGTGSGSIINQDGYVLTNNHVVAKAEKLFITLADGKEYEGKVVGVDPESDLAVIKFDPKGRKLVTIPLGTTKDLMVGNKVLAIGNPFGLERTLTTGIVSGLGRPIKINNNYVIREMIQTDASINPGNSGGPLLNAHGEMIGINTIIYSPSGGSVGIGFAVQVDIARRVIPELIKNGRVSRGWIDVEAIQLFPALVEYAKLPVTRGLLVSQVTAGGPAERAGIRGGDKAKGVRYRRDIIYLGGDIITEIDGLAITSLSDLYASLEDNKPGEAVTVKVFRDGRTVAFNVELAQRSRAVN